MLRTQDLNGIQPYFYDGVPVPVPGNLYNFTHLPFTCHTSQHLHYIQKVLSFNSRQRAHFSWKQPTAMTVVLPSIPPRLV